MSNVHSQISDGVWIKIAGDITGWNSVIGPDIIVKSGDSVETIFFHQKPDRYVLDAGGNIAFNESDNGKLIPVENGLLALEADQIRFKYYRLITTLASATVEQLKKQLHGRWKLNGKEDSFIVFTDNIEESSRQEIFHQFAPGSDHNGVWKVFEINKFKFLELKDLEYGSRQIFILREVNEKIASFYTVSEIGVEANIILERKN